MRGEFAFSVRRKLRTQNLQRRALRIRRGVRRLCETVDDCFSSEALLVPSGSSVMWS